MTAVCGVEGPHAHDGIAGRDWVSRVYADLAASGHRMTTSRRAVLERIAQADAPFSAEQLSMEIETANGRGSRSTVYRIVSWLRDRGWLASPSGQAEHAVLFRQFPGHYPATCTRCGGRVMLGGLDLTRAVAAGCSSASFTVEGIRIELFGRCGLCPPGALQA